jgi:hypothetical protein
LILCQPEKGMMRLMVMIDDGMKNEAMQLMVMMA